MLGTATHKVLSEQEARNDDSSRSRPVKKTCCVVLLQGSCWPYPRPLAYCRHKRSFSVKKRDTLRSVAEKWDSVAGVSE